VRGRSRYSLHSVMANSGFGDITLIKSDCKIIIPSKYITKEGFIYKRIQNLIGIREYDKLREIGVIVELK
jgi:hypothetical protein